MSLAEAIPTLESIKVLLEGCHAKVTAYSKPEDPEIAELLQFVSYDGELASLAREVGNQIRTADRPYTVAVVGEFKVGKSTLLNCALGLSGDAALSTEVTPDTACSILIRFRSNSDPESRLHYADQMKPEDVSWERAKQLTSQAWLDKNPQDQKLARQLLEVEYFLALPLLASINLNDLPGTGSRYWREHTNRTHESMKESDAIIWVIGDEEPSADAKHDLEILRECSQSVIPVLNVREDPSAIPPILRNQDEEDEIAKAVTREFKQFFAPQFEEPIKVSARVIELERAKAKADPVVLTEAGFERLIQVFDEMVVSPESGQAQGRLRRICGASIKLASDAELCLQDVRVSLETAFKKTRAKMMDRDEDLARLEDVSIDLRSRIKILAREKASEVVHQVGNQAKVFVGDTLQLSNWRDINKALSKGGKEKLNRDLKERFIKNYLMLDRPDNWLLKLSKAFAEDVRDVAIPLFRQLMRGQFQELQVGSDLNVDMPDLERLGDELVKAMIAIISKVLVIGSVAGLLWLIPGGQIIDAVAIVGLIILSMISDPLEGPRRRAINRVTWQMEAQKYAVADALGQAAEEGTQAVKGELRSWFVTAKTKASDADSIASSTLSSVQSGMDRLTGLIEGLQALQN